MACATPSGPKVIHGSEARSYLPPVHTVSAGTATWCHVSPPSKLALDTIPFEPPLLYRSC
jgi:hypothetical protein